MNQQFKINKDIIFANLNLTKSKFNTSIRSLVANASPNPRDPNFWLNVLGGVFCAYTLYEFGKEIGVFEKKPCLVCKDLPKMKDMISNMDINTKPKGV